MSDPTPLVDHVYQLWIDVHLEKMRNDEYDGYGEYKYYYNTGLLKELYAESKVQLPGCALHNKHINYYNHKKGSRDTTQVYTPSKMYVFKEMKTNILCQIEQEVKLPECILVVKEPDAAVTNSLLMACQQICENQAIVDLRLDGVNCKYHSDSDVFVLSKNAQSLVVHGCILPLQPLHQLMYKLSVCNKICKIDLSYTNLKDVSSLTLSNKPSLTHLDLSGTNMSAELCQSACQQLTDIIHLEYLNMSNNDFRQVQNFRLNSMSLRYLYLKNTHMASTLRHTIYQQLADLENLEIFKMTTEDCCYKICKEDEYEDDFLHMVLYHKHLPPHICTHIFHQINRFSDLRSIEITDSPLTGCLSSFLPNPHPGLPILSVLELKKTKLSKGDLQHLSNMLRNKLPEIEYLDLSGNTLAGCLSSLLPGIHATLPKLVKLNLSNTALNKEDLQDLSHITKSTKFSNLQKLDLSEIKLTGFLSSLLPDSQPGLPKLEYLYLSDTSLNIEDLQHLSSITQYNKLPNLDDLKLSQNTLTGFLSSFLSDHHPGLPELGSLDLSRTALNKEDLQHLKHLVQYGKLSELCKLHLKGNELCQMKGRIERPRRNIYPTPRSDTTAMESNTGCVVSRQ